METTRTVPAASGSDPLELKRLAATTDPDGIPDTPVRRSKPYMQDVPEPEEMPGGRSAFAQLVACCVGDDVPGVGFVHGRHCPLRPNAVERLGRATESARPAAAGEVPPTLRSFLRDEQVAELVAAARNLAGMNIRVGTGRLHGPGDALCMECQFAADLNGRLPHAKSCVTGFVLRLADELAAQVLDLNSARKGPATRAGETILNSHAGAGKPPRGDYGEPWQLILSKDFDDIRIYDVDGTLITHVLKSDQESLDWARRIVGCVNALAGVDDATVATQGGVA